MCLWTHRILANVFFYAGPKAKRFALTCWLVSDRTEIVSIVCSAGYWVLGVAVGDGVVAPVATGSMVKYELSIRSFQSSPSRVQIADQ